VTASIIHSRVGPRHGRELLLLTAGVMLADRSYHRPLDQNKLSHSNSPFVSRIACTESLHLSLILHLPFAQMVVA
jgi:hypothetical protein